MIDYNIKRIFKQVGLGLLVVATMTGCANTYKYIPSFWDDNQSHYIIQVRLTVDRLDCEQPHAAQVGRIRDAVDTFMFYSESKGSLQKDVIRLVEPMKQTVDDFYKRSVTQQGSRTYCELKKKVLQEQSQRAAGSVLGRW